MITIADTINANGIEWLEQHGDALFRYAIARVRDVATAEDLVQETLLAAIEAADGFSNSSAPLTWLTGILRHKIIDHYRRVASIVALDCDDDDLFDDTGHWTDQAEPSVWNKQTPESDLENRQLGAALDRALAAIPRALSTIFALREIEGLDRDEICDLLGISNANYWVMLHRARLRLRHELETRWRPDRTSQHPTLETSLQTA